MVAVFVTNAATYYLFAALTFLRRYYVIHVWLRAADYINHTFFNTPFCHPPIQLVECSFFFFPFFFAMYKKKTLPSMLGCWANCTSIHLTCLDGVLNMFWISHSYIYVINCYKNQCHVNLLRICEIQRAKHMNSIAWSHSANVRCKVQDSCAQIIRTALHLILLSIWIMHPFTLYCITA